MKPKQIMKIAVDVLMTAALMLLMSYSLVGEAAHEWVGIGMFALFIIHHTLNWRWCKNLRRGKYTPFRVFQTVLVALVLLCMLGSMASGVVLSRFVFDLNLRGLSAYARTVHMLSAYWGFVFMCLHLGAYWSMMTGMAKKMFKEPSAVRSWIVRLIGWLIAGYGVVAFIKREIGSYMLLKNRFVFFDYEEPLTLFFLDYLAIMGLYVFIGHYLAMTVKRIGKNRKQRESP